MKIIRNGLIPFGNYAAINLFGLLFVKGGVSVSPSLLNHERIHSAQMRELLWIPFYILYILEWIWRLIRNRGKSYMAYREISFEREAYEHEDDPDYLRKRRRYAQYRKE